MMSNLECIYIIRVSYSVAHLAQSGGKREQQWGSRRD